MRFSISQSELQNVLSTVSKGASTRAALPILAGVLISTSADEVTFQTTDRELSVRCAVPALVDQPGQAVLPAKLLGDIVKNLPDAAVTLEAGTTDATVTCGRSSFSIKGLPAEDFPAFPEVLAEEQVTVPFEAFADMTKKVARIASRDESRPILTGVLVTLEDGMLGMVATDSYRLAVARTAVETSATDFSAVIAASFLSEVASLPRTGEDVSIGLAESQIIVSYHDAVFVNRRIEGRYPNYKQILPKSFSTRAVFRKDELGAAVRRAGLIGQAGASVRFFIDADAQMARLSSVVQDVGSTEETLPARIEGPSVEIGFNGSYVTEGLAAIDGNEVALEMQSDTRPGIFKSADGADDYVYLVMPVRLS